MVKIDLKQIKKLRLKTKAGVMDCRAALEECGGSFPKATNWLRKKGIASAAKRADREAGCGLIEAYIHTSGCLASLVELNCETDFVARNEDFRRLAHEVAMQIAAMDPKDEKDLLKQPYIRDEKLTVGDLIKELSGKMGENIKVGKIARIKLGERK